MRIARIATSAGVDFAASSPSGGWIPFRAMDVSCADTPSVFGAIDRIRRRISSIGQGAPDQDVEFNCPIVRPSKILGIGLNYLDHIKESNAERPERPLVFAKYVNSLNGPYDPIVVDPRLTSQADWEVELAVVIGRRTRSVPRAEALSAVGGYLVANDVTARDWQLRETQFSRSKSFDTFCPIGPWITTADEIEDPHSMRLTTRVNDDIRQDSSTAQLLFTIDYLVHFLSLTMSLEPGDVILTGTPPGIGMAMEPPTYLQPGDTVTCEIDGLGQISNPVVAT